MPRLIALPGRNEPLPEFLYRVPQAFRRSELARWFTRRSIENVIATGIAIAPTRSILYGARHRARPKVRAEALTLWSPRLLLSGALALHLYAPELPAPRVDDVVTPRGTHLRLPPGARGRRVIRMPRGRTADFESIVTPEFAIVDAWNRSPQGARTDLLYEALWAGVAAPPAVLDELGKAARVAQRDTITRVVQWCVEGAMSPLEVVGHRDVFSGAEWSQWRRQERVLADGRAYVADMLHEDSKTIVEFDGHRYHGSARARERDAARDLALAAQGWVTVRLHWRRLREQPEWCRRQVRKVVVARRGRAA